MLKFSPNHVVWFLAKELNSLSAVVFVAVKSVKHKYMYTEHYTKTMIGSDTYHSVFTLQATF